MRSGSYLSIVKRNEHDAFVRGFFNNGGLAGKLNSCDQDGLEFVRIWMNPIFAEDGIWYRVRVDSRDKVVAVPDAMVFASQRAGYFPQRYLFVVEAKLGLNPESLQKMEQQLRLYERYIDDHPDNLYFFLRSNGLTDEEISSLGIKFSGVVRTKRSLREIRWFSLYEDDFFCHE